MTNPSRKRVVTSDDLDTLNRNSAYARQQGEVAAVAAAQAEAARADLSETINGAASLAAAGATQRIAQVLDQTTTQQQRNNINAAAATLAQRTATDQAIDALAAANADPADPTLLASRMRVGHVMDAARGTAGLSLGYNLPFWPHKPDREASLLRLLDSGARLVRAGVSWATTEPQDGVYDWAAVDWLLQTGDTYGLHILLLISEHAPDWAKAAGHEYPADPAKLARFVGLLAARAQGYKNLRCTVEAWNEPDLPEHLWPAADYAAAMVQCHDAARPYGTEVITGGLFRGNVSYLQAMYAAQPRLAELAGIGVHLYPQEGAGPEYAGSADNQSSYDKLSWVRAVMDANGHQRGALWLTETGWSTPGTPVLAQQVSEAMLARHAERTVAWLRAHPELRLAAALWYQLALDDAAPGAGTIEQHYGTHRADGTPKRHFRALQSLTTPGVQAATAAAPLGINAVLARAGAAIPNNGGQWFPSTATHSAVPDRYTERVGRRVLQRDTMTADSVYDELHSLGYTASTFAVAGWFYPRTDSTSGQNFELLRLIDQGYAHSYSVLWNDGALRVNNGQAEENATYGGGIAFTVGQPLFVALSVDDGWATVWLWTPGNGLLRYELRQRLFPAYSASNPLLKIIVQSPGRLHSGPLGLWPRLNDADVDAMLADWWPTTPPMGGVVVPITAQDYTAAAFDITNTGITQVPFGGGGWDSAGRFWTVPASGVYQFAWYVKLDGAVPQGTLLNHGVDNLGDVWFAQDYVGPSSVLRGMRTKTLNAGDQVPLRIHNPQNLIVHSVGAGMTLTRLG